MQKKERILVLLPTIEYGGVQRVVSSLSQQWAHANDLKVVTFEVKNMPYPYGGDVIDLKEPSIPSAFGKLTSTIKRIFKLRTLFRQFRPDVIISFSVTANFPCVFAAWLSGDLKRLIISERDDPRKCPRYYHPMIPYVYPLAAKIVCVSKGVMGELIRSFSIDPARCTFLGNPVEISKSLTQPIPESHLKWMEGKKFFVAVGRLVPQKGFDYLLDAFAEMVEQGVTDYSLLILGEGESRPLLEKQLKDLKIEDRVFMPGAVDSPARYLEKAWAFVLSSRHEGWPNVLAEAIAMGCPAIAFNCPFGAEEIVEEGQNGLIVPYQDTQALANAMSKFATDTHERNRLKQQIMQRGNPFNSKAVADQWLTIL